MSDGPSSGVGPAPAGLPVGRILAVVGLVAFVPAGLYLVSIALEAVAIVLGVVGYFLGARRIRAVTGFVGRAAMLFSLLFQGYPVGPGTRARVSVWPTTSRSERRASSEWTGTSGARAAPVAGRL